MPTSRLENAIGAYVQNPRGGERVYAREVGHGKRVFDVLRDERAWMETNHNESPHLYEILTGPCNTYLDIEWKTNDIDADAEKAKVCSISKQVVQALRSDYGVTHADVQMVTASGNVKDKWKASWHVHIKADNMCWEDARALGQWVRDRFADIPEIDKVPYNAPMQNWRCVGSSKASEPHRVFRPKSRNMFMSCLVGCDAAGRDVVVNKAPLKRKKEVAPEWTHKLASLLGDMRLESLLLAGGRYAIVPFRNRVHCLIADRVHSSNHQYAVIDLLGVRWRMKCHNSDCAERCDHWRPFEKFAEARALWAKHVRATHTTQARPPVRVNAPPAGLKEVYCMRGDVPPIAVPPGVAWRCKLGTFVHSQAQES